MAYLDIVPAGTYTYKIEFTIGAGTVDISENTLQGPNFSIFEI
jgi:hypothetical protein